MIKTKQNIHVDFLRNFTRYCESNLIQAPGHSVKLHAILADFKEWESQNFSDDSGRFGATKA